MKRNTKIDQIMSKYVESIDLNKENDLDCIHLTITVFLLLQDISRRLMITLIL